MPIWPVPTVSTDRTSTANLGAGNDGPPAVASVEPAEQTGRRRTDHPAGGAQAGHRVGALLSLELADLGGGPGQQHVARPLAPA